MLEMSMISIVWLGSLLVVVVAALFLLIEVVEYLVK